MNSFISWIGGKKLLRKTILEMMPKDGYNKYVEVFGGAGWVMFGREFPNKQVEIFNDMDGNLINLWRCVKHHCDELQRELDWLLVSREQFFDAKAQLDTQGLTDIQRAARFYFLIRTSFGSDRRSFGTAPKPLNKSIDYLQEVNSRLERVVIEQKDFANLIKVYDGKDTFFYLDPPYYGTE